MTWNYRVLRSVEGNKKVKWPHYQIVEVWYNFSGEMYGWFETDISAMKLEELPAVFNLMRRALKKPVLEMKRGKLVEYVADDAPKLTDKMLDNAHIFKNGKLVKKGKGKPPKDFK